LRRYYLYVIYYNEIDNEQLKKFIADLRDQIDNLYSDLQTKSENNNFNTQSIINFNLTTSDVNQTISKMELC